MGSKHWLNRRRRIEGGGGGIACRTMAWLACGILVAAAVPSKSSAVEPAQGSPELQQGNNDPLQNSGDGSDLEVTADGGLGPHWVCYDGADPPSDEVLADAHPDILQGSGTVAYNLTGRWAGSQGDPIALTWSFVPDGLFVPGSGFDAAPCALGGANSDLFATLDGQFGSRAAWVARFQQVFDRWEELTGINFTRVTAAGVDWDDGAAFGTAGGATRGDIRITGRCIDGAVGPNVLAFNQFPGSGGDMVIDTANTWSGGATNLFLRNTVAHELGHGIGLQHVCPTNSSKLMEPSISTAFDGPQHDDIRAGQRHYGDPFEADNNSATATNLGIVTASTPVNLGDFPPPAVAFGSIHSIDADTERDSFSFTVSGPEVVDVTLTPIGLNYDTSTQNNDGTCNAGNFINSLAISDLRLRIIDTDGISALATSNTAGPGGVETLSGVNLPVAGTYFVRVVDAAGTPTEPQLYSLEIDVNLPPVAVCQDHSDFADDNCCITVDVSDIDDGSFDPNGPADIDSLCIVAVDGAGVGCQQSVQICDDGTLNPHSVVLRIRDQSGLIDTCIATVTIFDDTDPTVTCPADRTVECDGAGNVAELNSWLAEASATDNCNVATFTNDFTGLSDDCAATGSATVTWTATDDTDNTDACSATFTIEDTVAPVITACPDEIVLVCTSPNGYPSADVDFGVTATDACDPSVDITDDRPDAIFSPTCGESPTIVTHTATDDCNLATTCETRVHVVGAFCCPAFVDTDLTLMPADIDLRQDTNGPVTTKAKFDIWNENEVRFSGTERCITCWDQTLLSQYGAPNHFLIGNLQTDKGKARIDGMESSVCEGSTSSPLLGIAMTEVTFAGIDEVLMRAAMTPVGMGFESARITNDIIAGPDQLTGPGFAFAETTGLQVGIGEDPTTPATATAAASDEHRGSISKKGSVLYWPKVEIRWDVAGNVIQDTFLDISNDFPDDLRVQLYFVNGDMPTDEVVAGDPPVTVEREHPGWNNTDVEIDLTSNEPTYWSALTGQPKGVSSFTVLDPGDPPGRPDDDPLNPGGRRLRGFVVAWAVNSQGEEIRWNHLSGDATVVVYGDRTAWEYSAWAFQCVSGVATGEPCDATPGQLNLDGVEYDACPSKLLFNFYGVGSSALSHPSVR